MSINHENRVKAAGWAVETLTKLGHADLIDVISIEWNSRFTARLGDALYQRSFSARGGSPVQPLTPQKARVRFSEPLWPRATEKERYETVVHEICHIVCSHEAALAGRGRPQGHGWQWQALMLKAGVKPERCHNVDRTGLKRTRKIVSASCGCGSHEVTPYIAGRVAAGCTYTCRKCRQALKVGDDVAPVAKKQVRRRRRY